MEFTKIIEWACVLLKKDDLMTYSQINTSSSTPATGGDLEDMNSLKNSLILVINEIACDYFPLKCEQEFETNNGEILISNFTKTLLEVEKITDKFGNLLSYNIFPDYIKTTVGKVKVCYRYQPAETDYGDNIESFGGKIPERVFAYGVVKEFCFINGLYDDATMWDKRFVDAMKILVRKKGELKAKSRRWI